MATRSADAELCGSSGPLTGETLEPVLLSELVWWKRSKKNRKLLWDQTC